MQKLILPLLAIVLVSACVAQTQHNEVSINTPGISIVSPANGATIIGNTIKVEVKTSNIKLAVPNGTIVEGEGHLHVFTDEQLEYKIISASMFILENITPGKHKITAVLQKGDHSRFDPSVTDSITVNVQAQEQTVQQAGPQSYNVSVREYIFTPAMLSINVGDTISWTNYDSIGHSVTFDDGSFDTGTFNGGPKTYTFKKAGTYKYHCTPHPWMTGTITVK